MWQKTFYRRSLQRPLSALTPQHDPLEPSRHFNFSRKKATLRSQVQGSSTSGGPPDGHPEPVPHQNQVSQNVNLRDEPGRSPSRKVSISRNQSGLSNHPSRGRFSLSNLHFPSFHRRPDGLGLRQLEEASETRGGASNVRHARREREGWNIWVGRLVNNVTDCSGVDRRGSSSRL